MKTYIDTNILYYKYSNYDFETEIMGQNITSINALEFLKNIEKNHNSKANYYIPRENLFIFNILHMSHSMDHPFKKEYADSIIFDFQQDFESYTLYNNKTISATLNNKRHDVFKTSIAFLDKDENKELNNKFKFLINNKINCESISSKDIELGYFLLDLFLKDYSIKNDFRNSWNDILILARCINEEGNLISSDKLLNRFASNLYSGKISEHKDYIEIKFPAKTERPKDFSMNESKGYINRSWQYKMKNGNYF